MDNIRKTHFFSRDFLGQLWRYQGRWKDPELERYQEQGLPKRNFQNVSGMLSGSLMLYLDWTPVHSDSFERFLNCIQMQPVYLFEFTNIGIDNQSVILIYIMTIYKLLYLDMQSISTISTTQALRQWKNDLSEL